VRGFLYLAEPYKVFDEIDPHLRDLIFSQAIKWLEGQSSRRSLLLELVLDSQRSENIY
jgi:hypothetical protein